MPGTLLALRTAYARSITDARVAFTLLCSEYMQRISIAASNRKTEVTINGSDIAANWKRRGYNDEVVKRVQTYLTDEGLTVVVSTLRDRTDTETVLTVSGWAA